MAATSSDVSRLKPDGGQTMLAATSSTCSDAVSAQPKEDTPLWAGRVRANVAYPADLRLLCSLFLGKPRNWL